ncbi:MAG: UDP-glucose/GDP-mannose dehydrogenase family protein [Ignavibacteria bacterium]|jgi:UDPglucose 6-dehydrogenase|nr:UDP-glucose/GDP-mannose dehydrogenase family protein [Ignavibacteria bacterium]MCU7503745.1 UDP-glucose/GDP-mannose dehydrogenase family protein [Ignavibacteria bacterium]MCU7517241.1 UDP-glucose/GDP-mannose dehydrogenase family protein [Ignavibacteria bacterium]
MNISVIGTGYVGLVSGTCFADRGNRVICVDNNPEKLRKLQNSDVPIYEPGLEILFHRNIQQKRLIFTGSLEYAVLNSDIIFLCLPTPQDEDGSADLSYVMGCAKNIGQVLTKNACTDYKIIVNKSTVPVGTAFKVRDILKAEGVENFDVVSNPEFLREGFAVEDFRKPDRIVIGSESRRAIEMIRELYEPFVNQGNPILEMDTASAEVTKYASNSYLAMRITYMNELANFCERVGANVDMVRHGMGTDSRIGKRFLFAGIGYGGSCFPKDVNALIKTACEHGSPMNILEIVDKVNREQKFVLVKKVMEHFNGDVKGRNFAVWGLAFKPNTDDMREAPSIYIIRELQKAGAVVSAYDPAAMEVACRHFDGAIRYGQTKEEVLKGADALLVLTEWAEFRSPEFNGIKDALKNPVIFDGRNIYSPERLAAMGFTYYSIGRPAVGDDIKK